METYNGCKANKSLLIISKINMRKGDKHEQREMDKDTYSKREIKEGERWGE